MTMQTTFSGLAIVGVTGAAMILADVAITGTTHVSLEAAVGVGGFACGLVFWMGKKFQAIDDKFEALDKRFDDLPCKNSKNKKDCE